LQISIEEIYAVLIRRLISGDIKRWTTCPELPRSPSFFSPFPESRAQSDRERSGNGGRGDCKEKRNSSFKLRSYTVGCWSVRGYVGNIYRPRALMGSSLKVHLAMIFGFPVGYFPTTRNLTFNAGRWNSFTQDRAGRFKAGSGPYERYIPPFLNIMLFFLISTC
jgi:hypothetical protein